MKTLALNRRASFDYELKESYTAGLVLSGQEVKSAKLGHSSLKGSFVTVKGNELFLTNATITPYQAAGELPQYDPTHPRKLLLKKREISELIGKRSVEGLTLIPTRLVANPRGRVKLLFSVGKGKKQRDKRRTIADREAKRTVGRAMKENR